MPKYNVITKKLIQVGRFLGHYTPKVFKTGGPNAAAFTEFALNYMGAYHGINGIDALFYTPIRDWQVFDPAADNYDIFNHHFADSSYTLVGLSVPVGLAYIGAQYYRETYHNKYTKFGNIFDQCNYIQAVHQQAPQKLDESLKDFKCALESIEPNYTYNLKDFGVKIFDIKENKVSKEESTAIKYLKPKNYYLIPIGDHSKAPFWKRKKYQWQLFYKDENGNVIDILDISEKDSDAIKKKAQAEILRDALESQTAEDLAIDDNKLEFENLLLSTLYDNRVFSYRQNKKAYLLQAQKKSNSTLPSEANISNKNNNKNKDNIAVKALKKADTAIMKIWQPIEEITMWFWIFWFPLFIAAGTSALFGIAKYAALGLLGLAAAPLLIAGGVKLVKNIYNLYNKHFNPGKYVDPKEEAEKAAQQKTLTEAIRKTGQKVFIEKLYKAQLAEDGVSIQEDHETFKNRIQAAWNTNEEYKKITLNPDKNKRKYGKLLEKNGIQVGLEAVMGFLRGFLSSQFMSWWLLINGVALATVPVLHLVIAGSAIIAFLSSPIGIAVVFGITFVCGVFFLAKKIIQARNQQAKDIELKNVVDSNTDNYQQINNIKLEELEKKEIYNNILKDKLLALGIIPKKMPQPDEDGSFRQLRENNTNRFTMVKKIFNRLGLLVLRAGTGILVWRLLALGGVLSVALGVSSIAFPILLPVGIFFALIVMFIAYKHYTYHSKREAERRLVENIDVRLDSLDCENDLLTTQLACINCSETNFTEYQTNSADSANKKPYLDDLLENYCIRITLLLKENSDKSKKTLPELKSIGKCCDKTSSNNSPLIKLLKLQNLAKDLLKNKSSQLDSQTKLLCYELSNRNFYLDYNKEKEKNTANISQNNINPEDTKATETTIKLIEKIKMFTQDRTFWHSKTASKTTPDSIKNIRKMAKIIEFPAALAVGQKEEFNKANKEAENFIENIKQQSHQSWKNGKSFWSRQHENTNTFHGIIKRITPYNRAEIIKELDELHTTTKPQAAGAA